MCVDVGMMVSQYGVVWEMCLKGVMLDLSLSSSDC
jgi:hypothetical protein